MINRIIYGVSRRQNTEKCLSEVNSFLRHGNGENLIIIVPEQFSSFYEKLLVEKSVERGSLQAEILTFKRLAYRVFAQNLSPRRNYIDKAGKGMMMFDVVSELSEGLQAFEKAGRYPAFAGEIIKLISEFKRYGIEPDKLRETAGQSNSKLLESKLAELALIYEEYEKRLEVGGYNDADDDIEGLAHELRSFEGLGRCIIWFDGFDGFTPAELNVIKVLMEKARAVSTILCCRGIKDYGDTDVFHPVVETAGKIIGAARVLGINTEEVEVPPIKPEESGIPADLEFLSSNYFDYSCKSFNGVSSSINIYKAGTVYEEVERCALEIMTRVRSNKMKYGDICVVSGLYEEYRNYIEAVLSKYDIPVFLDEKRLISKHPIAVYLLALLDIYIDKYSYESVFGFLKSSYTDIPGEDIFELENYVLQWNIKGVGMWTGDDWDFYVAGTGQSESLKSINSTRRKIIGMLSGLFEEFKYGMRADEFVKNMFGFMVRNNVFERIKQDSMEAAFEGRLDYSDELRQSWNVLMDIFDQINTISGEKKQTIEKYRAFIEIALSQKRIGLIPPGNDAVFAGKVANAFGNNIKMLIIIGTNDPGFPESAVNEGLLTDRDRLEIKKTGLEIADDTKTAALSSQIDIYNLLGLPSESIYISYSTSASDGSARRKSGFIDRITDLFPDLTEQIDEDIDPGEYILTPISGLTAVSLGINKGTDLERWYAENEFGKHNVVLQESLEEIEFPEITRKLYGELIETSPTGLEAYAECPFKFFAKNALRAEPRAAYGVSPPDVGSILHDLLKHLVYEFSERKQFDYSECMESAERVYSGLKLRKVFSRDKRREYLGGRIVKRAVDSYMILRNQIITGSFKPVEFEAAFGRNKQIQAPCFIAGESRIYLKGRIDRVDAAIVNDREYFRIIDYKSSGKMMKLYRINEGLDIQLAAYLMAYKDHSGTNPAGMYYFAAEKPMVKISYGKGYDDIDANIFSEGKLEGYTLGEMDIIKAMDADFKDQSINIPVKAKADGSLSLKVMSCEQIETMIGRVGEIVVENAKKIFEGQYKAEPVNIKKYRACLYCEYKSICGFDDRKPGCNLRYIREIKDEDVVWGKK
ncbi:MAG: PD-(D/E)XK nuclease family protein [Clostridia bacterium]